MAGALRANEIPCNTSLELYNITQQSLLYQFQFHLRGLCHTSTSKTRI